MDPIPITSLANLRRIRCQAEDAAALALDMQQASDEQRAHIVAMNKAPARELGRHIGIIAKDNATIAGLTFQLVTFTRRLSGGLGIVVDHMGRGGQAA